MTHSLCSALSLSLLFAVACDQRPDAPQGEDLGDESKDGEAGKFDGADAFTYLRVENDFRKCVSPLCGGYWVSRVNRSATQCVDGSWADRCYVAEADLAALGLGEVESTELVGAMRAGRVIVRGELAPAEFFDFGNLGRAVVSEAWVAPNDTAPEGLFTRVEDSGIVCITTPCPNPLHEDKLNSHQSTVIDEVALEYTDATLEQIDAGYAGIYGDGLIVAGFRYWVWDGGWLRGRLATQFYTRVVPAAQ